MAPLRVASGLLLATWLVVSGYPRGALDGVPFDSWFDFAAWLSVAYLFVPRWREVRPGSAAIVAGVLVAAIGLRIGAGSLAVERGLSACYRPEGESGCARSTEFPERDDTRLDREIDFEGVSASRSSRWFPIDFLFRRGAVVAIHEPIDVEWRGWFDPPRPGRYSFRLEAEPPGRLEVAGVAGDSRVDVDLGSGPVAIRLAYRFTAVRPARIRLVAVEPGGEKPVVVVDLFPSPPAEGWRRRDGTAAALDRTSTGLALGAAIWILLVPLGRGRAIAAHLRTDRGAVLALWTVSFLFAAGFLFREGLHDPVAEIVHANDPAVYENEAKGLALDGPSSRPDVAHRSPVVRYHAWLLHRVAGTGMTHPLLIQGALYALAAALLYPITVARTGSRIAGVAVSLALGLNGDVYDHAAKFLPDPLGMILLVLAVAAIDRWARRGGLAALAGGGLLFGLAAVTRTDLLIAAPVVLARAAWPAARARRGPVAAAARTAIVLVLIALPFGALGLENRLVYGQWRFLPTSGPINFLMGNNVPREWLGPEAWSGRPDLDAMLDRTYRQVCEFDTNPDRSYDPAPLWVFDDINPYLSRASAAYVRDHPGHFAGQCARKFNAFFWRERTGRHFLPYTIALALALVALARTGRLRIYAFELGLLASSVLALVVYRFHERHRSAAVALILLLAGPLVAEATRWLRRIMARGPKQRAGDDPGPP